VAAAATTGAAQRGPGGLRVLASDVGSALLARARNTLALLREPPLEWQERAFGPIGIRG